MPKKPMTRDEIESMKLKILGHALELLTVHGFEGMSMRGIARKMGVVIGTLYGYYKSKDDLYLAILIQGFNRLYEQCKKAHDSKIKPLDQLKAMSEALIDFGINEPHFYNLMFTWHVPKFQDYVDTPLEATANIELKAALKVYDLFINTAHDYARAEVPQLSEEEVRFYVISAFCTLHGYIAGHNNTLINYMHPDTTALKDRLISEMFSIVDFASNNISEAS